MDQIDFWKQVYCSALMGLTANPNANLGFASDHAADMADIAVKKLEEKLKSIKKESNL